MSDQPDNLEVEVKFIVDSLADMRERLFDMGAAVGRPRVHERNLVYDNEGHMLRNNHKLLRLRQDERVRLTFKGPSDAQATSEAKVREEIEVEVSDFDRMDAIVRKLGFTPQRIYEKYRETFHLGTVEIVLDEMPFGSFIELEGPEPNIKSLADEMGLDWNERVVDNYLSLMEGLKAHHDLPFDDLTFDNFRDTDHHIRDIL